MADAQSHSLYRRHRPRTFNDVIGQEHVVRTLRNAVASDNVHHAYLFVGSRGTGKTSMAKILASALNAAGGPNADFAADDPVVNAIAAGTSMDVVEMDAASHNGVDDIRELIESVALAPTTGGWKVYILDEAHMITTAGWNAFLKTREEPPPNTVFVLATTEANKVLPTVADRCHRFDFRRPSVEQLSQAVRRAADAEGIEIGDDAVTMIARSATGSFRDALGTLEQLVTYGGKSVQADDVQAVLGVADFELLYSVADALASGDRGAALRAVAELADTGRDMTAFARDLAVHVRNLLIARTLNEAPPGAGLTDEQTARLIEQSSRFGAERTAHVLDLLSQMIQVSRAGGDPRLQLELALFKAARPEDDSDPSALIARIEALESRPSGAPAPAPAAAAKPAPAPVREEHAAEPAPADIAEVVPEPEQEEDIVVERVAETAEDAPPAASAGDAPELDTVIAAWPNAIAALGEVSPRLSTVLETARPIRIDGRMLTLGFPASAGFVRKTAEQPGSREQLAEHIGQACGFNFALLTEELDDAEFEPVGGAAESAGIDKDELIAQLKEKFDATEMAQPRPE